MLVFYSGCRTDRCGARGVKGGRWLGTAAFSTARVPDGQVLCWALLLLIRDRRLLSCSCLLAAAGSSLQLTSPRWLIRLDVHGLCCCRLPRQ